MSGEIEPREVTDPDGIAWSCIQAYAGLGQGELRAHAADAGDGRVHVVCTPTGGAKSVRLDLPRDWRTDLSDEELARAVQAGLAEAMPAARPPSS